MTLKQKTNLEVVRVLFWILLKELDGKLLAEAIGQLFDNSISLWAVKQRSISMASLSPQVRDRRL